MKSFTFNKVYILRSLNPNEKQLWIPGDELLKELKAYDIECEIIDIQEGIMQFRDVMQKINKSCKSLNVRPIIHFICHGLGPNQNSRYPIGAMCLWNNYKQINEIIEWKALLYHLELINEACHFNLFVSMSVCYGFYSLLKLFEPSYRIPFCGILATPDPVYVVPSTTYYTDFYTALIQDKNVGAAIDKLQQSLFAFEDWYKKSGLKTEEQLVKFSDDLFTQAAREDYQKNRSNNYQLRNSAIQAYKDAGHKTPPSEDFISKYIAAHPDFFWKEFSKLRDYQFMLDIYPDNHDRFELPYKLEDLSK